MIKDKIQCKEENGYPVTFISKPRHEVRKKSIAFHLVAQNGVLYGSSAADEAVERRGKEGSLFGEGAKEFCKIRTFGDVGNSTSGTDRTRRNPI